MSTHYKKINENSSKTSSVISQKDRKAGKYYYKPKSFAEWLKQNVNGMFDAGAIVPDQIGATSQRG